MSDVTKEVEILIPSLALDAPDLTPDKIKMALANHAQILKSMADAVNDQALILTSMLYTVRAILKAYPLPEDQTLIEDIPVTPVPGSTAGPGVGQYL